MDLSYESLKQKKTNITEKQRREDHSSTSNTAKEEHRSNIVSQMKLINRSRVSDAKQSMVNTSGSQTQQVPNLSHAIDRERQNSSMLNQMQIVDFSSNQASSFHKQMNSSFGRSSKQQSISASIQQQNVWKRNDHASTSSNVKRSNQNVANTSEDNYINYGSGHKNHEAIDEEWDSYQPREQKSTVDAIVKSVRSQLAKEGFDLMAWGSTDGYNQLIAEQGLEDKLQELPRGKLIIAAGNTKSIWPHITSYKHLNSSSNPFDDYSRATTAKIVSKLCSDAALKLDEGSIVARYTNEFTPDTLVSFTRLIQTLPDGDGELCFYQPLIHLLFHEAYGNWHAWRFALIFERVEWSSANGPSLTSMLEAEQTKLSKFIKDAEVRHAKQLMDKITEMDKQKEGKDGTQRRVIEEETSVLWLKVRQAFSLGRDAWMYPQDMLRYHYGNVPARYFESRSLSAQTGEVGLTDVQDVSEPVETEIKTGTCYDQDEFDDVSEVPPKSGWAAPPQASGSQASAQVPARQTSTSGKEKASKRQSSINSQEDGYSEEFEEILSDENLNNQHAMTITEDQFRQPFQKTGSNFGNADKGALEKKMSQTNKIDNIFEKSPRKSDQLSRKDDDKLKNKTQTVNYVPMGSFDQVKSQMKKQQQNDERSRQQAVATEDSLLSEKQNSNFRSLEARNVAAPAGAIIVASQHVRSQVRQSNQQLPSNGEIFASGAQQQYDINDYNPEVDAIEEPAQQKEWQCMESNPLKDWTFDLQNENNLFAVPDKDDSNIHQMSSGMMLGRQFMQRPQLRELVLIDKTTSLMSQQKQRMAKRFWGYKNQSHDIKKQSQQMLLRHQFINRRSDHHRAEEEKRKMEQQQAVGSLNSISQPCKEADLDQEERSKSGQTSHNMRQQLNSPSNQLSPSPESRSQQTKDQLQQPGSSRSINFVSTMRKGNIRFPFGYGKKMSTTGRHQQSIWQQPLDPPRDAMTMQGNPGSQLSSPFGAAGPAAIQQRLNMISHSQAEIGGLKADRTRQQMVNSKYLTNQINRSNTSNLTMVPIQAISSNDSKIQIKDFIKSELNKQSKKRQFVPQGMSRSTQRVGGNQVVITNITDKNATKKTGLVEDPDDNEESRDSVDLLDPNRQLQRMTNQAKASQFNIYNSKIRSDSNQPSQREPKQSGRSQDPMPTSSNLAPPEDKKRTIFVQKRVDADQSLNIELKNQKEGNFLEGIHNNSTNNSNSANMLSFRGPTSRDLYDRMKLRYAGISKDDIIRRSTSEILQKIKQNMKDQSQTMHTQKMGRLRSQIRKAQKYLRLQDECERAWKKAHESEKDRHNYQVLSQQLRALRKSLDTLPSEFGNSFNAEESIFSNRLSQIQGTGQDDSIVVPSPDRNSKNIIIADQNKKPDPLEVYSQVLKVKRIDIKPDLIAKSHKHDKAGNEKNQASLPDPLQASRLFLDAQRLKKIYKSSSTVQIKQGLSSKFSKVKNKLVLDQKTYTNTHTNTDESLQIRASAGQAQKSVIDVRLANVRQPPPQAAKVKQRETKKDADALTKSFNVRRAEASDPEQSYGDIDVQKQREKLQTAPANKLQHKQAAMRNTERYLKEKTAYQNVDPSQFLILEDPENQELRQVMDEIDKQIALSTAGTSRCKTKKVLNEVMSKRKSVSTQKQRQSWLLPLAEKYKSDPKSNNDLERELSHRMPYNQALTAAVSKRFPKKLVVNAADYHYTININRYLDQTMQYWYAPSTASHRLPSFPTKREQQQAGYLQKDDLNEKGIGQPARSSLDRKHEVGRVYGMIDETGEKRGAARARRRQEASREGEQQSSQIEKQHQTKKKSVSPIYTNLKITQKLYQGKK